MNEQYQTIMNILDTYKTAANKKDVDAFVALYDSDVVIFDMWGEWSYQGRTAWKKVVTDWFGSLGSEQVAVEINDTQITQESDMACVHAFVTFKGLSAEGEELRSMENRFTWVLINREGTWKILHEHSSGPVDLETSKVIFHRS